MWASKATPLAALVGDKVDLSFFALDLAVSYAEGLVRGVPFEKVQNVPPGSLLRLRKIGASIETWYKPNRHEDYLHSQAGFREALLDGIARRTRDYGTISSDFGGVDSSTLTVLGSAHKTVLGVTYADRWTGDEDKEAAITTVDRLSSGRITHRILKGGVADLKYNGLAEDDLPIVTDLPASDIIVNALFRSILREAVEGASDGHLTGEGGDTVLVSSIARLAGLFKAGYRREALSHALRGARSRHLRAGVFVREIVRNSRMTYGKGLRELSVLFAGSQPRVSSAESSRIAWCSTAQTVMWLTPEALLSVGAQLDQLAEDAPDFFDPGELRSWLEVYVTSSNNIGCRTEMYAAEGVTLSTPYLDTGVLDASLSLASYRRYRRGEFKPFATKGLADLLPESITARRSKVDFKGSTIEGMRQNASSLRALLTNSQMAQAGLVQEKAVQEGLNKALHGLNADEEIQRLLVIEYWLRHLDLRRSTWWREG